MQGDSDHINCTHTLGSTVPKEPSSGWPHLSTPCQLLLWDSLMAQLVKNLPAMRETWVQFLGGEDSPGEGNSYLLQYSGMENSMDCIIHGVAKSWI